MQLLIATGNSGKVKEFREILGNDRFTWSDLSAHRSVPAVEETGKTFRANACLKAAYYATTLKTWAMADDSGLEVDALDGSPGVYSARWAEINGSIPPGGEQAPNRDTANNALLLRQLENVPDDQRTGRFVCVLALSDPEGKIILTAQDSVEGRLLGEGRGTNGFGYDPLFYFDKLGKTTAELPSEQKHQISHRGKALRTMRRLMEEMEF